MDNDTTDKSNKTDGAALGPQEDAPGDRQGDENAPPAAQARGEPILVGPPFAYARFACLR